MKNLLIAIAMLFAGAMSAQQTGILTVDGQNYTVTGARVGVDGAAEYARGYDAGIASTAQAVTMDFVSGREPAMSVYQNGITYELQFSYEVDVVGADKRYDTNGVAPAFVYVEFLNTVPGTGSTAGQWQDPDYRLALEYDFRFGDPDFGQVIANNTAGSRSEIEDFHTLFVNPLTRATHARITIQHQSGVTLHRIIPITL